MSKKTTYLDYAKDDAHMEDYRRHQSRYAEKMRESDRVLIDLIASRLGPGLGAGNSLIDVGCSQGNLLTHLKRLLPGLSLLGADLAAPILAQNRANPALAGVEFLDMDMLAWPDQRQFDVVVTNAALMFFEQEQFAKAVLNLGRAVKKGGTFVAFDYFHPFDQEVMLTETSVLHPRGLTFYMRGYKTVRTAMEAAGLTSVELRPFHMPFDLPRTDDPTNVNSYTVGTTDGARLSFRGAVCQPWCHLVATKA